MNLRKTIIVLAGVVLNAVTIIGSTGVLAQDAVLEEIVVTATKREVDLQETSIAITAFGGEALNELAISNISDIHRMVPNVLSTSGASSSPNATGFSIRGIGQLDFINTSESGVGVYLDGVYMPRTNGGAIDLSDIERVEVLRGPQGTLFGRNTIGGAVSIVSKGPGLDGFSGELDLSVGAFTSDGQPNTDAGLSLNIPLSDTVATKINLLHKYSDGWGKNTAPGRGENLGEIGTLGIKAALLWQASENVTVNAGVDYSRMRGTVAPHGGIFGLGATGIEDPENTQIDTPTADDLDVFGTNLTIDWSVSENVDFRSITAYRKQDDGEQGQDVDGSPLNMLNQVVLYEQDQFSQEFQLFGTSRNGRLDWLTGIYYFQEEGTWVTDAEFSGFDLDVLTLSETSSYAVFANFTYHLTDTLNLVGGLRYTDEEKDMTAESSFGLPIGLGIPSTSVNKPFDAISPKIGLEYLPDDNLTFYVSYSEGFRSGGFNGRPLSLTDVRAFDEETNTNYEIGAKLDLLDNTLRLNAAAFLSEYDDIQLTAARVNQGTGLIEVVTGNAAKADMPGFELEIQWLPTENLHIYGAYGYTDNDEIEPKDDFSFNGTTLPVSSRANASLGFNYHFDLASYKATFGADWSTRTGYYPQFTNSDRVREDGYDQLNARLRLEPVNSDNWDLTFYGKNLNDELYRTFGQDSGDFVQVTWGRTREIGVNLRYRF